MKAPSLRQVLLFLPRLLLALAVLVHDILVVVLARPLRWLWALQPIRRLQVWIARQPAFTVLLLLVVPLVVLEPLKVLGLIWLATGRWLAGMAALVFAYGVSLVLIERIFDAGLPALLRWGWFSRLYGWFTGFRAALMARLRAMAGYQAVVALALRVRAAVAAIRLWLAARFAALRGGGGG